jgi:hypothetical protein
MGSQIWPTTPTSFKAFSTVASGAEQCGYGDLQRAVSAADVSGWMALRRVEGAIGHESKDVIMVAKEAEQGSSSQHDITRITRA